MTVILPTNFGRRAFSASYELDGDVYELRFRWNALGEFWAVDISRGGGQLLAGVRIVPEFDLLAPHRHISDLPPGVLRVSDTTGKLAQPDADGFGARWLLVYDEVE